MPVYLDTEFDKMIRETKPDTVIVTTTDCFHAKYICRAMELGCDVITEKPMATDEHMCQQIIWTRKRSTGKHVRVTFNYRYGPVAEKIKEILNSGELGIVTSVDYQLLLRTPISRRVVFSPLARVQAVQRLVVGPQVHPSFRSAQLVAGRGADGGQRPG